MEPLYSDLYKLYSWCFPQYPVSQETFWQRLCPEKARVFAEYGQGLLIGCALVHKASIPLLCVDREYRQQGVGARLLASAQGYILGTGARQITLGCGKHYLLQGVPEAPPAPVRFFQRHGYTAPWTSVNMELDLKSFSLKTAAIPPAPENVAFRMARVTDADALLAAVEDAQASWVPIFASCQDPVLLAVAREQIMGFQILSPSGGHFLRSGHTVGSIGCVGVVPGARNQGIGLRMVAQGAQWLKDQGCTLVELRYTWLESWYGRLGFRTVSRQWMGEKSR